MHCFAVPIFQSLTSPFHPTIHPPPSQYILKSVPILASVNLISIEIHKLCVRKIKIIIMIGVKRGRRKMEERKVEWLGCGEREILMVGGEGGQTLGVSQKHNIFESVCLLSVSTFAVYIHNYVCFDCVLCMLWLYVCIESVCSEHVNICVCWVCIFCACVFVCFKSVCSVHVYMCVLSLYDLWME